MKIAIGNDHAGYALKQELKRTLQEQGYDVVDYGCYSDTPVDYPIYGKKVGEAIASGECERGILICGTGIGISLAANKIKGIRCAACSEPLSAELSRRHNNANIVAIGARIIGPAVAEAIVEVFLKTEFEGGRHERRVNLISDIENDRI